MGLVFAQQETGGGETGKDPPPGPTLLARSILEDPAVEQADVVQLVLEFAPGSWTPLHTHGGIGLTTVIDGVITVRREDGTETTYAVGEMWVERPGEFAEAGNDGDTPARVVVTFLLPEGAELTTVRAEMGSGQETGGGETGGGETGGGETGGG